MLYYIIYEIFITESQDWRFCLFPDGQKIQLKIAKILKLHIYISMVKRCFLSPNMHTISA